MEINLKDIIIYEDKDILAINKPAGLMVHGDARGKEKTLADFILEKYPNLKEVGEPTILSNGDKIYRPGIVHRLDKETSGILLVAKNQESFLFLKEQFKNRKIKKIYQALVWGELKNKEGTIDASIGRSRSDFRQWSASRGKRGELREAVTDYKVLKVFEKKGEKFSLVEVYPKTGRTHQIRVHFKYINHPLVGDSLYGIKGKTSLGIGRLALHAKSIEFTHPNGKLLKLEAPLPQDLKFLQG